MESRLRRAVRPRGVTGPAGRALEAAQLIARAALDPSAASALVERAIDAAVEAEVLAACFQGRGISGARATAEQRALDICNSANRP